MNIKRTEQSSSFRDNIARMSQRVYATLGFTKGYAFASWFIFGGALTGFILARLQFLDISNRYCPSVPANDGSTGLPIACYWVVHFTRYRVAMILHLATSLPAGLLAVFQFVPRIRYSFGFLYHRFAGYIAATFAVLTNASAMMLADTAMGGDMTTRTMIGFVGVFTTGTLALAIYHIRRLEIHLHRIWMLRTWGYMAFILSLRIIQLIMASVVTHWPGAATPVVFTCQQLRYVYLADEGPGAWDVFSQVDSDMFESQHPDCLASSNDWEQIHVTVKGRLGSDRGQNSAVLMACFAAAGILALALHVLIVEAYIWMTPGETERLKQLSYERQTGKKVRDATATMLSPGPSTVEANEIVIGK